MPRGADKIRRDDEKPKLTARQLKFLPVLLASPTYTEACKKGRVSRDTLYEWFKDPVFKRELERQRDELVTQGFALLSQSVRKAVETLAGLLDAGDSRLRRMAAKDILDQHGKFKEVNEVMRRLEAIEQRLESRQR